MVIHQSECFGSAATLSITSRQRSISTEKLCWPSATFAEEDDRKQTRPWQQFQKKKWRHQIETRSRPNGKKQEAETGKKRGKEKNGDEQKQEQEADKGQPAQALEDRAERAVSRPSGRIDRPPSGMNFQPSAEPNRHRTQSHRTYPPSTVASVVSSLITIAMSPYQCPISVRFFSPFFSWISLRGRGRLPFGASRSVIQVFESFLGSSLWIFIGIYLFPVFVLLLPWKS